jgi:hypothetical protein
MTLSRDWSKDWAAEAKRDGRGTFLPREDEPLGKSNGIRFRQSVQEWLEKESERQGVRLAELVRQYVEKAIPKELDTA